MTSAGFIWNHPENPAVLGIHIHTNHPEIILFASTTTLLRILNIDPELVTP